MESQAITAEWAWQLCLDAFGIKDADHVMFVDPGITTIRIADKEPPFAVRTIDLVAWFDGINMEYSYIGYDLKTKTFVVWQNLLLYLAD